MPKWTAGIPDLQLSPLRSPALGGTFVRQPALSRLPTREDPAVAGQADRPLRLPVHHFLVTFTVPDQVWPVTCALGESARVRRPLRGGARHPSPSGGNVAILEGLPHRLLRCAAHLGARATTLYHRHLHFVVPGGGVSAHGSQWKSTPQNFLFHTRPWSWTSSSALRTRCVRRGAV